MPEEKKNFLDEMYKSLRVHDKEILEHFESQELSDQEYLFYAISSDIISNTINVLMALETNNLESFGVDNSCRTIIEAFVVLRMISEGDISDEQAKIFRYHYAIVDYYNMRKFIDEDVKAHDDFKYVQKDREKAYEAIMKFHNCSFQDLKKDPDFDDSNFYLKKKLRQKINFATLLKKYPVFNVNASKMYQVFSICVHPRFEMDDNVEATINNVRKEYIFEVLKIVKNFMNETKLFVSDDYLKTFRQEFYENPALVGNVGNITDFHVFFESIRRKTCYFENGYDAFSIFFYRKIEQVLIDMEVSMTFGYKEHIISLFKSVMEYIAIYVAICETESIDEFKKLKLAYCYSSRLQLDNIFQDAEHGHFIRDAIDTPLKTLFDEYYKEKYGINEYEVFREKMAKDGRFFLLKDESSFNHIVNHVIDDLYDDETIRNYTKMIYKISKDMNHGGGYAFNASPGLVDSQCRHVQNFIFRFMLDKLARQEEVLRAHGISVNLTIEKKFFEVCSGLEIVALEKVVEEYNKKPN